MQNYKTSSDAKPKDRSCGWPQVIFSFFLGALSGLIIARGWRINSDKIPAGQYEVRQGGYTLINPLLECETAELNNKELKNFRYKIQALINSKLAGKKTSHISVYFRDLNNGPWFGINEKEEFSPASLLKIPLMMSWLKKAESHPGILKKKITYESVIQYLPQEIPPEEVIKINESYTIEELIYRMIVYSDNEAKNLLQLNIDEDSFNKSYADLSIEIPNARTSEDYMSIKSYASFFRILYNASYLNKEMSELALKILSRASFKGGLAAGLPEGVLIAHKFGERNFNGTKQLHDCGIIYYPGHPYLLGVMTRGQDFKELAGIIKDISHLVYTEIDSQHR